MEDHDRCEFRFQEIVRETFEFLVLAGFVEIESSCTLVLYKKGDVEVDVYHGRSSYEVAAGVSICGIRYSFSEIIGVAGGEGAGFRYETASTPEELAAALRRLSFQMRRFGMPAFQADRDFLTALAARRKQWGIDYAATVLVAQLRPKAAEAFRTGDYSLAAELYSQVRDSLTVMERRKLDIAIARSKG